MFAEEKKKKKTPIELNWVSVGGDSITELSWKLELSFTKLKTLAVTPQSLWTGKLAGDQMRDISSDSSWIH